MLRMMKDAARDDDDDAEEEEKRKEEERRTRGLRAPRACSTARRAHALPAALGGDEDAAALHRRREPRGVFTSAPRRQRREREGGGIPRRRSRLDQRLALSRPRATDGSSHAGRAYPSGADEADDAVQEFAMRAERRLPHRPPPRRRRPRPPIMMGDGGKQGRPPPGTMREKVEEALPFPSSRESAANAL